jgi:Ca2+-transporting ATPase
MAPERSDDGLSEAEARARLASAGPNALPASHPRTLLRLLIEIVTEPMFVLLVACGLIYLLLGDRGEASMLLGFVVIIMAITFVQQRRTERALDALRDLSRPRALVLRDGQPRQIFARELVLGDCVLLAEGERIPADMELLSSSGLTVDESMLSGESVPVAKYAAPVTPPAAPAEASRLLFAGTLVTQGTARARVVATGAHSALGRIGTSLAGIHAAPSPIQAETGRVVKRVAGVGLALALALALFYWYRFGDWLHGLLAGITLAMAILPEELPVVLTIFLGVGAWRLARAKVLARSLPAIELLGATSVLCVDKTGTLTMNRMTVRRVWSEAAAHDTGADGALAEALHEVLEFAVLASHRRAFDPMESAIGAAGQTLLADTEHLHRDWTLVNDYPLSRAMLAMSRVWQSPDRADRMIAAKGAPEAIVDLCHLDSARGARIALQVARMAADGLRVLGVARARFAASSLPDNQHDFDFEFLGLIALEDPLRPDVPQAIAECHAAGMQVVMITGDHRATAISIARQAGLDADGAVMSGAELDALGAAELTPRLSATRVFCRIEPEQKLRLVQAFQARGEVVAMTGDGVNDAPALKAADIGVAMGARGTDVAREAAALVLLNDDFGSLLTAVRHGRRVFANLRKAIVFVVAAHVPIVGLSILPVLLGWPMLLMPVHILFLQLIIDPACSIVFEAEPLEADAMARAPRAREARLFERAVLLRGLWQGAGLLAILVAVNVGMRVATESEALARTLTFCVLVLSNLGLIWVNLAWHAPSWRRSGAANASLRAIALGAVGLLALVVGVPAVRALFSFALPSWPMLAVGALACLASLLWFEAVKWRMASA